MKAGTSLISLMVGMLPAVGFAQKPDSPKSPVVRAGSELVTGKRLFDASCARCHGIGGVGDLGPALTRAQLRAAPTDSALWKIIQEGIPGTSMPGAFYIVDDDAKLIARYVRSLGRVAAEPITGDAMRGSALYRRAGCASCHTMAGAGGVVGPELTGIGLRRSLAHLRRSITDPAAALPEEGGRIQYLVVRAETLDGRSVIGTRVNEDGFSIQIRDVNGRFHSFRKTDLRKLDKDFTSSLMPSYRGQFTQPELDDLVAYLATEKGGTSK